MFYHVVQTSDCQELLITSVYSPYNFIDAEDRSLMIFLIL